ncbi:MAG: hypothetical protein ABWY54_02345 [Glaciihabitans sp.]
MTETTTPGVRARIAKGTTVAIAALFGLFYAYFLFDAIRSLIELPAQYELVGVGRENAPWTLLVMGVIIPVVVFLAAMVVGRRRSVGNKAVIYLVGLGAVACLGLSVIALG